MDFTGLKASPVRLLVSAVNVETAQLEIFDSYVDNFIVDHLLASGSHIRGHATIYTSLVDLTERSTF